MLHAVQLQAGICGCKLMRGEALGIEVPDHGQKKWLQRRYGSETKKHFAKGSSEVYHWCTNFEKNNRFTDERLVGLLSSMRTAGGLLLQNEDWEALVNRLKGHLP